MAPSQPRRAGVLIIGDEILSGRTQDTNLSFLGRRLHELGIILAQARILPDQEDIIADDVLTFAQNYDYVFTTGGIGPTHDDITTQSVAKAFAVPITLDQRAKALLQKRVPGGELTQHQLKMAHVPKGATLIENPITYAPGFYLKNVFVLAGVPQIMQAMFENITPQLQGGAPFYNKTLRCLLGESILAPGLESIKRQHPNVSIGSYPFWGANTHGASIVLRSQNVEQIAIAALKTEKLIHSLGGSLIDESVGQ
ncbi:MAG: molybdopterin-binding protein [Pseudomonadota bacterium]